MATFPRELKVSKTDAFEIDVSTWLSTESIISLGVVDDAGLTTVVGTEINGSLLSVLLTGLTAGDADIHFTYSTATRSDCYKATVKVIADC
tara:strand:- start:598 stop:870 length:273 start_codon:yes stop_codon:yes gene_type:complete